jgi:uncharacterized membrane protein YbhN (UPF0104 family)
MRSLYAKIFLWFLSITIVTLAVVLAAAAELKIVRDKEKKRVQTKRWLRPTTVNRDWLVCEQYSITQARANCLSGMQ